MIEENPKAPDEDKKIVPMEQAPIKEIVVDKIISEKERKATQLETFTNQIMARIEPILTTHDDWYRWDGKVWRKTTRSWVESKVQEHLPEDYRNPRTMDAIVRMIKAKTYTEEAFIGANREDEDIVRVNLNNAVLVIDLNTGELKTEPHDSRWRFTKRITTDYLPDAKCPLFMKFLETALPEESDSELLGLIAGTIFIPAMHQTSLILEGETETGKSTITDTFKTALGKEVVCSASLVAICENKGRALEKLEFAMLNISTEIDQHYIDSTGPFKQAASGEEFWTDPKYKEAHVGLTNATFIFCVNLMPMIRGGSYADVRRTRFIAMDQQVDSDEINIRLKRALATEKEGVLAWMISYIPKVLKCKVLPYGSPKSRLLYDRFGVKINPVASFIAKHCRRRKATHKPIVLAEFIKRLTAFMKQYGVVQSRINSTVMNFYKSTAEDEYGVDIHRARLGFGDEAKRVIENLEWRED